MQVIDRTTVLLLANGAVLAAYTHMAKFASAAGAPPLTFALALSGGAAILLCVLGLARRQVSAPNARLVRYGLVAGLLSIALPQALVFAAAPRIGGGIAALAYAFPTPLTFALAVTLGMERATALRTLGLAVACAGAVWLAFARSASIGGEIIWIALAMLAPFAIAGGNIFRARNWPPGATSFDLALAMALGAGLWLGTAICGLTLLAPNSPVLPVQDAGYTYLAAVAVLAAFGWILYFELQKSAGIVTFSQMGYVGAGFGLLAGALLFGESYSAAVWASVSVIATGIVIAEWARRRAAAA
ncbi:DMT family transporter [Chelatococcus sp. SYSU_G07232]|uniref:DMT family transporter n=1 Tax=Chelatococcus albus TaxID=3047466 RepID=A0ABT7AJY4_9HYPH|nr:DMT family transporter [Chelatococcus sp. SYSU_G07232]MDJ1159679.1 DMT family transporter [Chelatococcus sp. SYSU_G07232]